MHDAPNASAVQTPSHFAAASGARHRFSPVGGAANGMPLYDRTAGAFVPAAPDSWPLSIFSRIGDGERRPGECDDGGERRSSGNESFHKAASTSGRTSAGSR